LTSGKKLFYDGYILMKKITALLTGLSAYASAALPALATSHPVTVDPCPEGNFNRLCSSFNPDRIGPIVGTVINILLVAAVLIALFFLIWGGIRWITSGGDKGKVEEARKHIVAAIVGLVVAFLAYFIIQIILSIFGLGAINTLSIPKF
jgi:hypothetical protein